MIVTLEEIREKLKKIDWDIDVDLLKNDISLSEQGIDSLDMMDLILCLEKGFSVSIPDTDLSRLKTLAEFAAYLNRKA